MSTYYTQEQLDSIGVLIANKIASNGEELKQFVQDKINELEPVAPPAPTEPEAGDGTTPAPAAGMFLDDGREIKQKLLSFTLNGVDAEQIFTHDIDIENIISVEVIAKNIHNRWVQPSHREWLGQAAYNYYALIEARKIIVNLTSANYYKDAPIRFLITYLA